MNEILKPLHFALTLMDVTRLITRGGDVCVCVCFSACPLRVSCMCVQLCGGEDGISDCVCLLVCAISFFVPGNERLAEKVNRKEKERKRQEKQAAAASAGKRAADEDELEDDDYEGADVAPTGDERARAAGGARGARGAEQGASRQQEQVYELECPPYTKGTQFPSVASN